MTTYAAQKDTMRAEARATLPADILDALDADATRLGLMSWDRAKRVGDRAPDFTLTSALGREVTLAKELQDGPVVLVFYRGAWCPYCNLLLRLYQQHLAEFKAAGAKLLAVSPMVPDRSQTLTETAGLGYDVLSDPGAEVMDAYGLVFEVGEEVREIMRGIGADLPDFNGDQTWHLPVPATYVVDRNGFITFAAVDGDYRERAEPAEILAAVSRSV